MYTSEDLNKANTGLKTTDVKGKDYVEVNERIRAFRSICPMGAIVTDMLSNANGVCVFKATILDEQGAVLGTGHAYENESSSYINKTSYIENCETSAVGRALGMCGLGINTAVASAEEVRNAIANQQKTAAKAKLAEKKPDAPALTSRQKLINLLAAKKIDMVAFAEIHKLDKTTTEEQYAKLLAELEADYASV